ncbi:helix-turn-helix transcriptional regulator [Bacillus sp. SM2101]|uniref:helix-turn-helix transcriptional regulator n=1 Tax=Bacillus sp. SM2101 TaxID=2805366 RepID=UPI001BDE4CBD|nr:helix-turn-helix transcriptional regulator [Bacillus sp. SM2101]
MKPAILFYPCQHQKLSFEDWFGSLMNKVTLITVSSFRDVEKIVKRESYSIYILLTNACAFPKNWTMSHLKVEKILMILTGINGTNNILLNSFLDTLETYIEPSNSNSLFQSSLSYIEENLCEHDLSLEKVASQVYVSKYHYSRMFQKNVGIGFKEYIIRKRIQKAKLLLQKGDSVTDVCFSIGYNDLTHFARMFKKIVGINPSVYRTENLSKSMSLTQNNK